MNCGEIHELLPLWTTGELEASRRLAVGAHLHDCPDCAAELRQREAEDALLREAMAVESARDLMTARDLERRVMRRIADERSRRWLWPSVAAAAATLAAVLLLTQHHPVQANPAVFSDAARDHTVEIVQKAARHWRTAPAELAALEDSQGISDADVKAVEAGLPARTRKDLPPGGSALHAPRVCKGRAGVFGLHAGNRRQAGSRSRLNER